MSPLSYSCCSGYAACTPMASATLSEEELMAAMGAEDGFGFGDDDFGEPQRQAASINVIQTHATYRLADEPEEAAVPSECAAFDFCQKPPSL
ncbi:unnamed protein product [Prorocentrum cordatum]|uniref:Uncharacterized protein n=1 Tax=Prorocentrum cordatum TaxID=2364126 RepID=A0ABN9WPY1_9DINO|nr:unnamed protein product [Polarella glacialis]